MPSQTRKRDDVHSRIPRQVALDAFRSAAKWKEGSIHELFEERMLASISAETAGLITASQEGGHAEVIRVGLKMLQPFLWEVDDRQKGIVIDERLLLDQSSAEKLFNLLIVASLMIKAYEETGAHREVSYAKAAAKKIRAGIHIKETEEKHKGEPET